MRLDRLEQDVAMLFGTGLLVAVVSLAAVGCGAKCKPKCPADQQCQPAWTESSGPFGSSRTEGPPVCQPKPSPEPRRTR